MRVPAGTTIYTGPAAEQLIKVGGNTVGQLSGGGLQVYIPQVDPKWLVP